MLDKPQLPQQIAEEFRRGLMKFVAPADPGASGLEKARLEGIPIVRLRLDSLTPERLRDTPRGGWLVLATTEQGIVYGAEILDGPNGPEMGSLWRDPSFPTLLKQIDEVVRLEELGNAADVDVKLLSIPGILTDALWLTSGERQFLVPVRVPDEEILPRMRAFELDLFFSQAERQAAAFRDFDEPDPKQAL